MITAGQLIGILSAFPKDHWVMFTGKDGPVDFDPHCIQEFANRLIIEAPNDQKLARELDDSEQRIEELKERIEELEAGIAILTRKIPRKDEKKSPNTAS